MTRHDEPAFPTVWRNEGELNASAPDGTVTPPGGLVALHGLTKRELFAMAAMQGLLASGRTARVYVARDALDSADDLLSQLNAVSR